MKTPVKHYAKNGDSSKSLCGHMRGGLSIATHRTDWVTCPSCLRKIAKKRRTDAAKPLTLKIGRRHFVPVTSLEEASREYQRLRDESGEGGSTFPDGKVGNYRISYNGRVWDGAVNWVPGVKPVMEAAA